MKTSYAQFSRGLSCNVLIWVTAFLMGIYIVGWSKRQRKEAGDEVICWSVAIQRVYTLHSEKITSLKDDTGRRCTSGEQFRTTVFVGFGYVFCTRAPLHCIHVAAKLFPTHLEWLPFKPVLDQFLHEFHMDSTFHNKCTSIINEAAAAGARGVQIGANHAIVKEVRGHVMTTDSIIPVRREQMFWWDEFSVN